MGNYLKWFVCLFIFLFIKFVKEINKEIRTRSRLRNKIIHCRSNENKKAYNEQRNDCVKLVRSAKKAYYSNLSIKDVNDNKNFEK